MGFGKDSSISSHHLPREERILLGSYYTPAKYVEIVADWLKESLHAGEVILDPSCGDGAFFPLRDFFPQARFLGNDMDPAAVRQAGKNFPGVRFTSFNALRRVSRRQYGLSPRDPLTIVGNPPYNDTTSLFCKSLKRSSLQEVDEDIRTRDLGLSSLLAYDKLKADRVAVLHPLSYLIKKANYQSGIRFFQNYRLRNHLIFSSQEFAGASPTSAFPVLVALYERAPGEGITYEEVLTQEFHTVEGDRFRLADMEFVTDYVVKYPRKTPPAADLSGHYFYTLRDINALRRCQTFLRQKSANAVAIPRAQLPFYQYIDAFKHLAQIPYWAGNLNVPFRKDDFPRIAPLAAKYSATRHADLFGESLPLSKEELTTLKTYIRDSLYREHTHTP